MNFSPEVSVIIPCYNNEKDLPECLDSLIAQTDPNWEAILVIAPSNDETARIAVEYAKADPRFVIYQEPKKSTCATARNIGFHAARGDYIAFLDADDWWDPRKLEVQLFYMKSFPGLSWTCHELYHHNYGFCPDTISILPPKCGSYRFGGLHTILIKRQALEAIIKEWGYLFYEPMRGFDDGDLSLRLTKYSHAEIPLTLGHYRRNESGISMSMSQKEILMLEWGIVWRNRAFGVFRYRFKDYSLILFKMITGVDLVELKKEFMRE